MRARLIKGTLRLGAIVVAWALASAPAQAATINVTFTGEAVNGDGQCSLREAITAANQNSLNPTECTDGDAGMTDTLTLSTGNFNLQGAAEDLNAGGDLDVLLGATGEVVIDGAGPVATEIDANGGDADPNDDRVLDFQGSGPATVQDLTVREGLASGQGGGILARNGVDLTLSNVSVILNQSTAGGGVTTATDGGALMINGATIEQNNSTVGAGGGVLHQGGDFAVANSLIHDNDADGGVAGANVNPAGTATTSVSGSRILDNDNTGVIGGMRIGMFNQADQVTIEDSRFEGNDAGTSSGGLSIFRGTAKIEDTVINDNSVDSGGVASSASGAGLGISSGATVSLTRSAVTNNEATAADNGDDAFGGGIRNTQGDLTVRDSTIAGNVVAPTDGDGDGGGIWSSGSQGLTNTTVSGNTAGGSGGGIFQTGSVAQIVHLALIGNDAGSGGDAIVSSGGALVILGRSIIEGAAPASDCLGSFESGAYNVAAGASCGLMHPTDQQGISAGVLPLADNGGRLAGPAGFQSVLQTHALPPGSVALDRVPVSNCVDVFGMPLTADARGLPRPVNGACDAGAFELQPPISGAVAAPSPAASAPAPVAKKCRKGFKPKKVKRKRKCVRKKKKHKK